MQLDNTYRGRLAPITKADLPWFETELLKISIFFPEPLHLEVPGIGELVVGTGYGGFSHTLFSRGDYCTGCGRCCLGQYRRTWLWSDHDPAPEGAPEIEVLINGHPHRYSYHLQTDVSRGRCDYLEPVYWLEPHGFEPGIQAREEHDLPMWGCVLFGDQDFDVEGRKQAQDPNRMPPGCQTGIFVEPKKVNLKRGQRYLLSRRLPSRNWRWPDCPVDVYSTPYSSPVSKSDIKHLTGFRDNYRHIPGSCLEEALALYKSVSASVRLEGRTVEDNILLEDYFAR